jgi:hypothetical protein
MSVLSDLIQASVICICQETGQQKFDCKQFQTHYSIILTNIYNRLHGGLRELIRLSSIIVVHAYCYIKAYVKEET